MGTHTAVDYHELDFSGVEVIKIPVKIGDQEYVLAEASGDAEVRWRNASYACREYGPEGNIKSLKNLANLEPLLVHLCLFEKDERNNVPEDVIRAWPARVQKALYKKAYAISRLAETNEERVALQKVLDLPGSPCTFARLREWVASQNGQHDTIKLWLRDREEEAKN